MGQFCEENTVKSNGWLTCMLSNPQTIIVMLHTMYIALNIIQPELLNLLTDILNDK